MKGETGKKVLKIRESAKADSLEDLVRETLAELGEDPSREGLVKTPARVARALRDLTKGYQQNVKEVLNGALFVEDYEEMITVKDIVIYSLCVPGRQIVNAVDGARRARDLNVGDQLWTLNEGQLRKTTITRITTRSTRDIVRVCTEKGTFKLTSDHPVMTERGWEEAGRLRPGDRLEWTNPRSLCRKPYQAKPGHALGYVMGAVASDGSLQEGRRINLTVRNRNFAEKFSQSYSDAFETEPPDIQPVVVPSGFAGREVDAYRVRTVSRDIGNKLSKWLSIPTQGSRSKTKTFHFPKVVTSSREMMQGFLDGYCDGDGYKLKRSGGRMIVSSNRGFLQEMGRYLETPVGSNGSDGTGRLYISKHWDRKGWFGRHGFRKESDFYLPLDSDWVRVLSVEPVSKTKKPYRVHAFTCEPYPTFLVRGHLTHNCEHHLLPFFGRCHVAYIPKNRIVGLSKIVRLVDVFARRLQVQERLTNQIAKTLQEVLDPQGVAVVVEAEHLCMQMRGVEKRGSSVVTSSMLGAFRSRQATREEFMNLIGSSRL